jgi:hypothetical protein
VIEAITTVVITAGSVLLFAYWFRYTCLLILSAKTAHDYAGDLALAKGLRIVEVLMPRSIVHPFLRESPRLSHIEQIAQACETSLTASAYRLCELSSFRVAMVWSEALRVRWYKPSEEFVRWVRKGSVRQDSYAFDAFEGRPVPAKRSRRRRWLHSSPSATGQILGCDKGVFSQLGIAR